MDKAPDFERVAQSPSTTEKMLLLGEATFLFLNSPIHLRYALHQLPTFILTPIRLGQFRIYRTRKGPVGFVAWAYLNAEVADAYVHGRRELTPDDWRCGEDLWFIEFVAPFGHAARIREDLRRNVFPGQETARSLHRHEDGRPPRVVRWQRNESRAPGSAAAVDSQAGPQVVQI